MEHRTEDTDGQYAILRLARFPLPDNEMMKRQRTGAVTFALLKQL